MGGDANERDSTGGDAAGDSTGGDAAGDATGEDAAGDSTGGGELPRPVSLATTSGDGESVVWYNTRPVDVHRQGAHCHSRTLD
jgi:hypothetical protein